MRHDPLISGKRKPVNLTLDTGIVAAAREAGLNLSQISEAAIRAATKKTLDAQWQEQHREAIEAHNLWVEQHGLPLARYRLF